MQGHLLQYMPIRFISIGIKYWNVLCYVMAHIAIHSNMFPQYWHDILACIVVSIVEYIDSILACIDIEYKPNTCQYKWYVLNTYLYYWIHPWLHWWQRPGSWSQCQWCTGIEELNSDVSLGLWSSTAIAAWLLVTQRLESEQPEWLWAGKLHPRENKQFLPTPHVGG